MAYQCCYTNLLRYDGPYKVGGWTVTAFSRDIPPEVLRDCERFQRADASDDRPTDEFGKTLRLYELLCADGYAYVMRTRYGMRDHMGRGNNLFSHAYILPLDGEILARPELICGLDASAFTQEAGPGIDPETESAELARLALGHLREGQLPQLPHGDIPDFLSALDGTGFSVERERYKTLLQCVYAHMDAKRESGRQLPPLYIQYEPGGDPDRKVRQILCCILYGLPLWMRRQLRASNWTDLDNTPKDLIFTTEDVTRLSGDGAYLVLRTGARNVERRRMARLERSGYLPYAALRLDPEDFPAFFAGLDRYAKALGDTDGTSEVVRKLVWQCCWDPERRSFTERPDVGKLGRKELISLLSDAAESGLYSMGMREVVSAARKRIDLDTLTESLRGTLESWDEEYRRRHGMPDGPRKDPHPVTDTQSAPKAFPVDRENVSGAPAVPEASTVTQTAPDAPDVDTQGVPEALPAGTVAAPDAVSHSTTPPVDITTTDTARNPDALTADTSAAPGAAWNPDIMPDASADTPEPVTPAPSRAQVPASAPLPVKDWEAVERGWRELPDERRKAMLDWLEELLEQSQTVPLAEAAFRRQMESEPPGSLDLYFLLMIDRKVSGKLSPLAVVRAYCHEELARTRDKVPTVRWKTLSEICSVCERMRAADLAERVRSEAWELYQQELVPLDTDGHAVALLGMYEAILRRLYPSGGESKWNGERFEDFRQEARRYYWERTEGNWKYFSFLSLPEYDAFDDGRRHMFPTLIRLANSFRPKKAREFLRQIRLFFETSDTPGYYTDENRLRITALLFEELDRRYAGTLPADYRGWMNLVTVAEEKGSVPAVQELFEAMEPFDVWKVAESYPRFLWKCRDGGDRKAREAAYPLVRDACFSNDATQAVPLDLWITLGMEALSFYELYNCFAIFERKPDAAVLDMDAAEAVRDSSLMSSPAVLDYARAYVKYRGETRVRRAVCAWLDEVFGRKKKRFGVF